MIENRREHPPIAEDSNAQSGGAFLAMLALLASAVVTVVQGGGDYTALDSFVAVFLGIVAFSYKDNVPTSKAARAAYSMIWGLTVGVFFAPVLSQLTPSDQLKDFLIVVLAVFSSVIASQSVALK